MKEKFELIINGMSFRNISETFNISNRDAIALKKGKSVRIDSKKLIEFLDKIQL